MKSQYLVYTIVALVVAGVAYWVFLGKGPGYMAPSTTPTPYTTPSSTTYTPVSVTLGEQNKSGETGTVTLTESDGKTTVVVTVTGEPSGAVQPMHIHSGACPTPGAVVYPLTNLVNGTSTTTIMATLDQLKAQFPLAINAHTSATQMSKYTACGDLKW